MFLIVNPIGTRPVLADSFTKLCELGWKTLPDKSQLQVHLIKPGNSGKYDLLLTVVKESVSGNIFLKGEIINNPKNKYNLSHSTDALLSMMTKPVSKGKTYDIADFFPKDFVINGHIPLNGTTIPKTVMDDWDNLTEILDNFFNPKPTTTQ